MAITLGGTALTSTGWFLVRTSGLDDVGDLSLQTATIPGREEAVVSSLLRTPTPRDGVLTVGLIAQTEAALVAGENALHGLLPGTEIALTHPRRPNQRLLVHFIGAPASYGIGPELVAPFYLEYGLRVKAVTTYWEDDTEQTVNFTTAATDIPQGTADTRGVITVAASGGIVNDPIILYKDATGATIATLAPTIAIADGDAWRCDVVLGQVRKRVSGTWSNAVDTLPDDWRLPIFRREHGVYATADWPTLQTSAGNGSVVYRRRYR